MKTFIVSDLHGNGEVYNSIMAYLENVNKEEKVKLYINGDLIDRGLDSFSMLEDVMNRIINKESFEIEYLGGNHELMMWDALRKRKPGNYVFRFCDWMENGGYVTDDAIYSREDREEVYAKVLDFIGKLKIYNLFDEKIGGNRLLLVHASAPKNVYDDCEMRIEHNSPSVYKAVWDREYGDYFPFVKNKIGKEGYLTIIGHTPVSDSTGFYYNEKENFFNIDGACAFYAIGGFEYDHVPLVEVEDGRLTFIVFNHNNEIIDGYTYDGELSKLSLEELNEKRKYIDHKYDNSRDSYKK